MLGPVFMLYSHLAPLFLFVFVLNLIKVWFEGVVSFGLLRQGLSV